jgi:hypothetical protein
MSAALPGLRGVVWAWRSTVTLAVRPVSRAVASIWLGALVVEALRAMVAVA